MRPARGFTLLELMVAMSIAGIGLSIGTSLLGSERLSGRRHEEAFRRTAGASAALALVAEDLRQAIRVVPRERGPGALVFLAGGDVAVYYDAPGERGTLRRRLRKPDGTAGPSVRVAREIEGFTVTTDGRLATARVEAGVAERTLTVRMRHVE